MNEKIYKTMSNAGAGNIVVGITVMVTGVASGILLIVHGAKLLRAKKECNVLTSRYFCEKRNQKKD